MIVDATARPPAADAGPRGRWAWFDGGLVPEDQARLGPMTHALHYGTGCFEGIRAYWNEDREQLYGMRLREHCTRLLASARTLLMEPARGVDELVRLIVELLRRNRFREDVYVRPLFFKSGEELGVRLHDLPESLLVLARPYDGGVSGTRQLRCGVSSWRRQHDPIIPPQCKCTGAYAAGAMVKSQAVRSGYDEAILLTPEGNVSEATASNLFAVREGVLLTPPVGDGILAGITRATLIELARTVLGIAAVECSIRRAELLAADEVFLCGTALEVAPVVEIDGRTIGSGAPGPVTSRLGDLYGEVCRGRVPAYRTWLTEVYG